MRAHLAGGLLEHARQLLGIELGGHVGELGLEEDEAQGIFERLHLGIVREVALAHDRLHSRDRVRVVARLFEDLAELARVLLVEVAPPT